MENCDLNLVIVFHLVAASMFFMNNWIKLNFKKIGSFLKIH